VIAVAGFAASLRAAPSVGAAPGGEIAVVDWDDSAHLSAIVLIHSDRLATRANSRVVVSGPGKINDIAWTPDGKTLVYYENTDKGTDLCAVGLGSPRRRLLAAYAYDVYHDAALSPDGTTVAYSRISGHSVAVYLVGVDGGPGRRLTTGFAPAWSPDGSRLALLAAHGRIETIGADGSDLQVVGQLRDSAGRAIDPVSTRSYVTSFKWAPDGRGFLATTVDVATFAGELETFASDGTVLHVVSRSASPSSDSGVTAEWSPDGAQVAFSEAFVKKPGDAVVVNADGSGRHTVAAAARSSAEQLALSWSPDGQSIVTADGDRVRVVHADGTQAKVIAFPGEDHAIDDPAWQPVA
jgi:Tol biopolymer transport system component